MRPPSRIRSVAAVATALALSLGLAACGSDEGGSGASKPVTLRFTWWGSDARHAKTKQVIEAFQKEHPNIVVKGEFKEWVGYWDSLATTVAANDAPDVIQMDELYLSSYAQRGALLDLGPGGLKLDTGQFDPKILATGAIKGQQFGVPAGVTSYAVVANTDILAKYKIPLPDDSTWTWSDLEAIGDQVSKASKGKVRGVQSWGFDTGGLNIWARQAGAKLYDAQGKVVIPPAVLADFWKNLKGLAADGAAPPPATTVERANGALEISGTASNQTAFGTWWTSQLPSLSVASGQKLRLLRLPGESQSGTPAAYFKPSMFWSASARTKHPQEVKLFLDYLANSPEAAGILSVDRGIPANTASRKAITSSLSGADAAAATYIDTLVAGPAPLPTPNGASNVEAILKRYTEEVLFGRVTPDAAAASFIKELQSEIDAA